MTETLKPTVGGEVLILDTEYARSYELPIGETFEITKVYADDSIRITGAEPEGSTWLINDAEITEFEVVR